MPRPRRNLGYPVNGVAMEVLRLSKKGMVDISRPTTRPPVAIDSLARHAGRATRKMRVLTFTTLFPNNIWPRQGVFIKERMSHVARLGGCDVTVVAPVPYFPPIRVSQRQRFRQVEYEEMIDGFQVFHPRYFMVPKVGMTSYGVTMFLSVASLVRRIQRRFDFDLIDAHYAYPDGLAAVLLGRLCRKPVVLSARGSDINVFGKMLLIRRLIRYTLRQADAIIAVSDALKERIVDLGLPGERVAVISNGVDTRKFCAVDRDEARTALGFLGGRLLLSVGNLLPIKGFDVLIAALKILVERGLPSDVRLVIVGDGPERRRLKALVSQARLQERVSFVGEVPQEQLRLWYNAADVFCLTSRSEGCPNVVLEAIACGTPVVASAVGGVPEIIQSELNGLLCRGRPSELADAIERALSNRWDPVRIASQARERYSWDERVRGVVEVFRSVVGPTPAPVSEAEPQRRAGSPTVRGAGVHDD